MNKNETPKTAQELVEKWLPEYENRIIDSAMIYFDIKRREYVIDNHKEMIVDRFIVDHFSEALATREAKLIEATVKATKENCVKNVQDWHEDYEYPESLVKYILSAPSPTPEQIKEQMEK